MVTHQELIQFEYALFDKLTKRHNEIIHKLSCPIKQKNITEKDMDEWVKYTQIAHILLEPVPTYESTNEDDLLKTFLPLMTIYSTYKAILSP